MDELLNCCPKCGSTLEFSNLMQYSDVYKITRSGKLSKKRIRKEDCGPMECGYISCTNCDFVTDAELDFFSCKIYFILFKYYFFFVFSKL